MPLIGVKRARSEQDYQTSIKKASPAPGFWSRLTTATNAVTGYIAKLISYDYHMNQSDNGTGQPMKSSISDGSVKHDVFAASPRTRQLHTPVLSELERKEKCCVVTPTTLRQPRSLLFSPKFLSSNTTNISKLTLSASRQPSSTIVTSPNDQHSQVSRPISKSSRSTSKDWSIPPLKDQTKSRYQSISTSQSSSSTVTKSRTLNDHSSIFSFIQTPPSVITTNCHISNTRESISTRTSSQSNTNSPSSPQGDLRQWISEFKNSYQNNRRDVSAQIDAAEKYARLQSDQRNQLCDHRMEQLRKRFDTGLDISELLIDEKAVIDQPELRLRHDNKEKALIRKAFNYGPPDEELSGAFRIRLKRRDFHTLHGMNWLNDEVVNFYMSMVADACGDVHSYSSFFYPKLIGNAGYSGVRRWTKKVDIFSKRLLLIPVHLGMHWCLATIDFTNKQISYYDSLLGHNPECLRALKQYLVQEANDKKQMAYDTSEWQCVTQKNIPVQQNGSDCGVFMCMYARHLARNKPLHFRQDDMPVIREHMVLEMLEKKLI